MKKHCLFFLLMLLIYSSGISQEKPTLSQVRHSVETVNEKGSWAEQFTDILPRNLPTGTRQTLGGIEYQIIVSRVDFRPEGTLMTLILSMRMPYGENEENQLYFVGSNIPWSEEGGFLDGEIRLELLHDFRIPMGRHMEVTLLAEDPRRRTQAVLDCYGLKSLHLATCLTFDRELLVPAGDTNTQAKVRCEFELDLQDWKDWIVDLHLPPFELATLPGWEFQAQDVVLDWSESLSSARIRLPAKYRNTHCAGDEAFWRGIYLGQVEVKLPAAFENRKKGSRFGLRARDLLIDEVGFSGEISAQNLFSLEEGHAQGWALSLSDLALEWESNRIVNSRLEGMLRMPIDTLQLKYTARLSDKGRFFLQVALEKNLHFGQWGLVDVHLQPESALSMDMQEGEKIHLKALLHGDFSLHIKKNSSDKEMVQVPKVAFQNLIMQNQKPYFQMKELRYEQGIAIAGFPVQIGDITLKQSSEKETSLDWRLSLSLTSAEDGAFRGDFGMRIRSEWVDEDGLLFWRYKDFSFDDIALKVDYPSFSLDGKLKISTDDAVYGDGFSGKLAFGLKTPNIQVSSAAFFGKKDDFRYWFVDAFADLGKAGIPIFTGLAMNSFSGGAYNRMNVTSSPPKGAIASSSGLYYIPDQTTSFGILGGVGICAQSNPKLFNGQVRLELSFHKDKGLKSCVLNGQANIAQNLDDNYLTQFRSRILKMIVEKGSQHPEFRMEDARKSAITASVNLALDIENESFDGRFETSIQSAMIQGEGRMLTHFSPGKWYAHLGNPERKVKIFFGVGNIGLRTDMYLMAGDDIPQAPEPPDLIRHFLNVDELRRLEQGRDMRLAQAGRGFAFGSSLALSSGDLRFLLFTAQLEAAIGFDLLLKDYGSLSCLNRSSDIGINGWYAQGLSYAYLGGNVGIRVKVFGKERHFTILDARLGTLLEAQLPNPSWFGGQLKAQYNILNGLLKGHCLFKFELGEKCQLPTESALENLQVISDLKPDEQSDNVSVYSLPQAAFNFPIRQFKGDDGLEYKVELDKFSLLTAGENIDGDLKWSDDQTSICFEPKAVLPAKQAIEAEVRLRFLRKNGSQWVAELGSDNQALTENRRVTFHTSEYPREIPLSQIRYAYPVISQRNYYPKELDSGFIVLKQDHGHLFDKDNAKTLSLAIYGKDEKEILCPLLYDASSYRLSWKMPTLEKNKEYSLKLICRNQDKNTPKVDKYTSRELGNGSTLEVKEKKIQQVEESDHEDVVLAYTFRTAAFDRFSEALKSNELKNATLKNLLGQSSDGAFFQRSDAVYFDAFTYRASDWDPIELWGSPFTNNKALIEAQAVLENNPYYGLYIAPLLYAHGNFGGYVQLSREAGQTVAPVWAISCLDPGRQQNLFPWTYDLPLIYRQDLEDIQLQLAYHFSLGKNIQAYASLLQKKLPAPIPGKYYVRFQYRLPDGRLGSSFTPYFNYIK